MINCQIGFCIVNHVRTLNVVIWENLSLEELLYTICIGFVTHKITKETSLAIDDTGVTVNNICQLTGNRIVGKFFLQLLV